VYDTSKVEEADLGVNFFLEVDQLGESRAKALAETLGELNPDVKGHWSDEVCLYAHLFW
jgi:amyloid beta precursor protein binding protein 1